MALVEPVPSVPSWARYTQRPFPPYRFVPGLNPHPRRDPRGHAYGQSEAAPPGVLPERWKENEHYLYGIDLYNFAFWWECHEQLEGLWHRVPRESEEGRFLQGIIQVAAANLQRHAGAIDGARRLAEEAIRRLASMGRRSFMGLELGPFLRGVHAYHVDEDAPRAPLILLQ